MNATKVIAACLVLVGLLAGCQKEANQSPVTEIDDAPAAQTQSIGQGEPAEEIENPQDTTVANDKGTQPSDASSNADAGRA